MAIPERDTVYTNDGTTRSVYTRESSSTGWFVGIIVALALLAIGYLVFSANSGPATVVDTSTTTLEAPATPAPVTEAPAGDTTINVTPMTEAPAATPEAAPIVEAPAPAATDAAPATEAPATDAAPAADAAAPVTEPAPAATTSP
jgi:cytoskeletal protein RodZ